MPQRSQDTPAPFSLDERTAPIAQDAEGAPLRTAGWTSDGSAASTPPAPGGIGSGDGIGVDGAAPPQQVDSYLLLGVLGHGGMGVVYRARDLVLGREVALKMVRTGAAFKPGLLKRFHQEAKAIAQLKHPHIVQILDFGECDGQPYFTMGLAERGSLYRHLEHFQGDVRRAVALMEKVARAVQHIHEHSLLHRDLKPGNILLDRDDEPLVSDFGLAKSLELELELTRTGHAMGTPSYMAPEQAAGRSAHIGPATDVWALGVILYELACGKKPFTGDSREEVIRAINETDPAAPRSLTPHIDRGLETILVKCLEKDPSNRYQSAGALAAELGAWLRGDPIQARPLGAWGRTARAVRRHPVSAAALALGVMGVVGLLATLYLLNPQRRVEERQALLERGEEAILVPAEGLPGYRRWKLGKGVQDRLGEDGVFCAHAADLGLLELMPNPKIRHYQLRGQIRQLGGEPAGQVGFYVLHEQHPGPAAPVHAFCQVTFNDFIDLSKMFAAIKKSPQRMPQGNRVQFYPHLYQNEKNDSRLAPPPGSAVFFSPARQWREVVLVVSPGGVSCTWDGRDAGALEQGQMNAAAADAADRLDKQGVEHPYAFTPAFTPEGGLGLYLDRASAAVKNVVITPLPEAP